ncbi:hypothetical protein [Streptomyces sp. NPDC056061]|uniref:hypothetical protein n=1 Tax=Streptomyces sp. NPDC056061 TaxID=3345700 RepID=UPI0035E0DBCB
MVQRQYFCPHCNDTFSIGPVLQDHIAAEHPQGDDHRIPAEMQHFAGSATESGWVGDEPDALWV